ncbi:hypothetical protein E5675_18980 [Sphingopyxis sp. PAMC25046]|uniref:antA/AntB antirepressor family protein n=1 Tax=Sphingopyxis sp. PAMC25046 TaxID=2565556 RepID=UPI00109DB858|nr:antA/AntB antirepressor family protein [Sphingopyxis sp. PAMC25046]QCB56307.1 hypothetical protein E5675_18980 [Sphingopyxis sp. PAMC25046]
MRQCGGDHTHEAAALLPLTADNKVDARSLHGWLGVGRNFPTWFGQIVSDYGFEEGADFCPVSGKTSAKGGRPTKEYLLTLDVAKEIAMIGNTPKGKATRRYFIAAEKAAAKMAIACLANTSAADMKSAWGYLTSWGTTSLLPLSGRSV